jgi:anaphase-promoting complex subunit 8
MNLPDHWMKHFFLGHMYLELQMNDEALEIYEFLQNNGFSKNSYVLAQIAIAYHNRRGECVFVV